MSSALIELHYLPPIAYFVALSSSSEIILERHERYVKQSYRNRCYINTAQGREMLSIPVVHSQGQLTTDVKIDYNQKWQHRHWRAIQTAYGKAPFYEFYAERIRKVIYEKHDFLYDLNLNLLSLCLTFMKWNIPLKETSQYEKEVKCAENDLRGVINTKNEAELSKLYQPLPYIQVFGNMFESGLSVLDLIFCMGPNALELIKQSRKRNEQTNS